MRPQTLYNTRVDKVAQARLCLPFELESDAFGLLESKLELLSQQV